MGIQLSEYHLLKRLSFLHYVCLASLWTSHKAVVVQVYKWVIYSVPSMDMFLCQDFCCYDSVACIELRFGGATQTVVFSLGLLWLFRIFFTSIWFLSFFFISVKNNIEIEIFYWTGWHKSIFMQVFHVLQLYSHSLVPSLPFSFHQYPLSSEIISHPLSCHPCIYDFMYLYKIQDWWMIENMQFLSFWEWFNLFNMVISSCIHFFL